MKEKIKKEIYEQQILCTVIINREIKNEIQQRIDAGLNVEQIVDDLGVIF